MKIDYFYHHYYNFNAPLCLNGNIYNRRTKWGSNIKWTLSEFRTVDSTGMLFNNENKFVNLSLIFY